MMAAQLHVLLDAMPTMPNEPTPVLVVIEESELGVRTAAVGAALAARLRLPVVFQIAVGVEPIAVRPGAALVEQTAQARQQEQRRQRAAHWLGRAIEAARGRGAEASTVLTTDQAPLAAVLRIAQERSCALIVVGSQGRGALAKVFTSSLASDLIQQSPVPVLVCRDDMASTWLSP